MTAETGLAELQTEAQNINELVQKGLITPKDASALTFSQATELGTRAPILLSKYIDNPQNTKEKVNYLIKKETKGNISRQELVLRSILAAAILYLKFQDQFLGIIFYGSRNRLGINRPGGDQDCYLIVKDPDELGHTLPLSFEPFMYGIFKKLVGASPEIHYLDINQISNEPVDAYPEICSGTIPVIWDKQTREVFNVKFSQQMKQPQDFSKIPLASLAAR